MDGPVNPFSDGLLALPTFIRLRQTLPECFCFGNGFVVYSLGNVLLADLAQFLPTRPGKSGIGILAAAQWLWPQATDDVAYALSPYRGSGGPLWGVRRFLCWQLHHEYGGKVGLAA